MSKFFPPVLLVSMVWCVLAPVAFCDTVVSDGFTDDESPFFDDVSVNSDDETIQEGKALKKKSAKRRKKADFLKEPLTWASENTSSTTQQVISGLAALSVPVAGFLFYDYKKRNDKYLTDMKGAFLLNEWGYQTAQQTRIVMLNELSLKELNRLNDLHVKAGKQIVRQMKGASATDAEIEGLRTSLCGRLAGPKTLVQNVLGNAKLPVSQAMQQFLAQHP